MRPFSSKNFFFINFLLISLLLVGKSASAQEPVKKVRFLFVLDCSGSMLGNIDGKQKMIVARQVLARLVDSLNNVPGVEMALRAYGHQSPDKDCKDTKLEVGFETFNAKEIKERLKTLHAKGTTPIAYSLEQAAGDFPDRRATNILILITDGLEECKGDPCAVSQTLQNKGIVLRPFVIGLGMSEDYSKQMGCVGKFYGVNTESEFRVVLNNVIAQSLEKTTLTINLLDVNGKPRETEVNMSFYNAKNNALVTNYYHTLDGNGKPDTFKVEAGFKYDIEVHTTPPIFKKGVEIKPTVHNLVEIPAAQGTLKFSMANANENGTIKCLIKKNGTSQIIYVQDINTTHKFLIGIYDVEILTLPKIKINKIQISQSKSTPIIIPENGVLQLSYYNAIDASIFILRNNKMEWVVDVTSQQGNGREVLNLQPGSYKIVYKLKDAQHIIESREVSVSISSGSDRSLILD
ncbi:MAG: VWA domain-containing protein [Bacteroidota bacterium]|nr:VWA domain-containing protein [Bacteroidota bacterium]